MDRSFIESFAVQSIPVLAEQFDISTDLAQAQVQSLVPFDVNFTLNVQGNLLEAGSIFGIQGGANLPKAVIVAAIGATLASVSADPTLPFVRDLPISTKDFVMSRKAEAERTPGVFTKQHSIIDPETGRPDLLVLVKGETGNLCTQYLTNWGTRFEPNDPVGFRFTRDESYVGLQIDGCMKGVAGGTGVPNATTAANATAAGVEPWISTEWASQYLAKRFPSWFGTPSSEPKAILPGNVPGANVDVNADLIDSLKNGVVQAMRQGQETSIKWLAEKVSFYSDLDKSQVENNLQTALTWGNLVDPTFGFWATGFTNAMMLAQFLRRVRNRSNVKIEAGQVSQQISKSKILANANANDLVRYANQNITEAENLELLANEIPQIIQDQPILYLGDQVDDQPDLVLQGELDNLRSQIKDTEEEMEAIREISKAKVVESEIETAAQIDKIRDDAQEQIKQIEATIAAKNLELEELQKQSENVRLEQANLVGEVTEAKNNAAAEIKAIREAMTLEIGALREQRDLQEAGTSIQTSPLANVSIATSPIQPLTEAVQTSPFQDPRIQILEQENAVLLAKITELENRLQKRKQKEIQQREIQQQQKEEEDVFVAKPLTNTLIVHQIAYKVPKKIPKTLAEQRSMLLKLNDPTLQNRILWATSGKSKNNDLYRYFAGVKYKPAQ